MKGDGGAAYSGGPQGGVTVRDYLAARAMAAYLSTMTAGVSAAVFKPEVVAKVAYSFADAMMAERMKR